MSTAERLRRRAAELRGAARVLQQLDARRLLGRAGTGTWMGPTADRCVEDLLVACALLARAEEVLQRTASALDRQADQAALAERSSSASGVMAS